MDGAFLLTMAKMYMSVKESPYTKEEVEPKSVPFLSPVVLDERCDVSFVCQIQRNSKQHAA